MPQPEVFDPVQFSIEENQFLVKYLGQAPEVVEIDCQGGFPLGVNPHAVIPALERIFRMVQMAEHRRLQWVGVDAVKAACTTYVAHWTQWQKDHVQRGGPKLPSMFAWDSRGKAHKGAVDTDSTQVSTYFDAEGHRERFAVELLPSGMDSYVPAWIKPAIKRVIPTLIEDDAKGTLECPVCHFTQNFDPAQRSTYNMARGRMAKHLIATRKDPESHREVYTECFGAATNV